MKRMKPIKDTTISFIEKDFRKVDGAFIKITTANGWLQTSFEHYPRIKLNIVYKTIKGNHETLRKNITNLRKDILDVLEKNGFKIQREKGAKDDN